ncbi:MAG TPA: hypothetical protein VNA25_20725 [Phycisphaerae bacterium]|nr:hypothetical protein [Phycisphaerae bacterium]
MTCLVMVAVLLLSCMTSFGQSAETVAKESPELIRLRAENRLLKATLKQRNEEIAALKAEVARLSPDNKAGDPDKSAKESPPTNTLAYKLAVINAGGYVTEKDITVTRFAYLLCTIEAKTSNTTQQIADMSVGAVQNLRENYGRDVKLLDFMEGMNRVLPGGERSDYALATALYMQVLKK